MALQHSTTKPFQTVATRQNNVCSLIITGALLFCSAYSIGDETKNIDNPSQLPVFEIKPYTARYDAYAKGKKLGSAIRTLVKQSEFEFTFQFNSKLRFLFFSDQRRESVTFRHENNAILPLNYQYKRSGSGSDKALTLDFDHAKQELTSSKQGTTSLDNQSDPQSYFINFKGVMAGGGDSATYNIVNQKGQPRRYLLKVQGQETLSLAFGEIEALKVEVSSSNKNKTTYAWFSPSLNYTLVKLVQIKQGKQQGRVELADYQGPVHE